MKRKMKKLIGQVIFLSCFYISGGMFLYLMFLSGTTY